MKKLFIYLLFLSQHAFASEQKPISLINIYTDHSIMTITDDKYYYPIHSVYEKTAKQVVDEVRRVIHDDCIDTMSFDKFKAYLNDLDIGKKILQHFCPKINLSEKQLLHINERVFVVLEELDSILQRQEQDGVSRVVCRLPFDDETFGLYLTIFLSNNHLSPAIQYLLQFICAYYCGSLEMKGYFERILNLLRYISYHLKKFYHNELEEVASKEDSSSLMQSAGA